MSDVADQLRASLVFESCITVIQYAEAVGRVAARGWDHSNEAQDLIIEWARKLGYLGSDSKFDRAQIAQRLKGSK